MKSFKATITFKGEKARVNVTADSVEDAIRSAFAEARKELSLPMFNSKIDEGDFAFGRTFTVYSSLPTSEKAQASIWVREETSRRATPADTYEVAEDGSCRRCSGSGKFITMVENGVPKGPGGPCYRCDGKGFQMLADVYRNYQADIHQRVL